MAIIVDHSEHSVNAMFFDGFLSIFMILYIVGYRRCGIIVKGVLL